MKPLDGTFAHNAEKWGVAGLNIDGGRIGTEPRFNQGAGNKAGGSSLNMSKEGMPEFEGKECQGRWPANLILDEEAGVILDEQSGERETHAMSKNRNKFGGMFGSGGEVTQPNLISSSGGASRFFYCAKASRAERNAGLEGMPLGEPLASARSKPAEGRESPLGKPRQNFHPTIKPLALMEYLCTLLKPPTEHPILLDPFCGSGTTLMAAVNTGWDYVGIEKEKDYCEIAEKRVAYVKEQTAGHQMALFKKGDCL